MKGARDTFEQFESLLKSFGLASLGPDVRSTRLPLATLEKTLVEAFDRVAVSPGKQALIRSLLLLWHDHLDESHHLSQEIQSADGSYLHGMMHRREPDFWNSKYWFNRVGNHPAFGEIGRKVENLTESDNQKMLSQLVVGGKWNPSAFVDLCEAATKRPSPPVELLQRIQQIEFQVLLQEFCR